MIKQILRNLLSNAVKFTPPEGEVSIGVRADPHGIAIVIKDTGVGLAPEDVPITSMAP